MKLHKPIQKFIEKLETESLSEDRKSILQPLVDYINLKAKANQTIKLNFICTHNSRRSHLAQVWAQALAEYFNVPNIECFSGGTENTAVYPMVIETLENAGFEISKEGDSKNPLYSINFASGIQPIIAFSKKYDDDFNPQTEFAAIMTCSQADGGCPFVAGSKSELPLCMKIQKFQMEHLSKRKFIWSGASRLQPK